MAWLQDDGDENEFAQLEEDGERDGVIEEIEEEVIVTERPGAIAVPVPPRPSAKAKTRKKSKPKAKLARRSKPRPKKKAAATKKRSVKGRKTAKRRGKR